MLLAVALHPDESVRIGDSADTSRRGICRGASLPILLEENATVICIVGRLGVKEWCRDGYIVGVDLGDGVIGQQVRGRTGLVEGGGRGRFGIGGGSANVGGAGRCKSICHG